MSSPPLFSLPVPERRKKAHAFVGKRVELVDDAHRDGSNLRTYVGTLVAVAITSAGSLADVAVIDYDPKVYPAAISLARVRSIKLAPKETRP